MNQKQIKIGNLTLDNPFILAPMAGITDGSFRRICRGQGAALVYSEMVSAKGLWYEGAKSFELLSFKEEEKPIAFQLFGNDPEIMGTIAERLNGYENAILDVNMGCPVAKVTGNGEGSALMKDPDRAGRILEAICSKSKKPVTAKIRAGWDESHINAAEVASILQAAGAAAIAIHGRTREQYYSGKADWIVIADVKAAVDIPVIGSGDVMTSADAVRMMQETGCDAVMIARGALGNPWIFKESIQRYKGEDAEKIREAKPTLAEKVQMFCQQAQMTAEEKGEYTAVREMRKQAGWYFKGVPGATKLRARVNKIETIESLLDTINQVIA
ncbi:MAG: tRNA dihydrouridine synthase DusB [Clostridiales Family XIII bacterium]|jgi:tRNA-dihydrouridine synthase B|nr:tRNA dihydrouridine synthase DusB [Clostridiales Family XIII bacterium]